VAVLGRRASTREQRRATSEAQLLTATRELLAGGEGFADLSVEQITTRAGTSRTSFYDYFRDKRDLLIRLVEGAAAPIVQEADELIGGRPSDPSEIPFTIDAAVTFAREDREVFRAVVEAATYDPVVASFWRERFLNRFIDAIEQRIRRQQKAGEALPIAPRQAATALVLMVTGALYHHVTSEGTTSDAKLREALTTIAVRAIYGTDP
jgi:AcrR family transcriptional regulator